MPGFQFVAVLAILLFTGAALYINWVEHPARMECGPVLAATVLSRCASFGTVGGFNSSTITITVR